MPRIVLVLVVTLASVAPSIARACSCAFGTSSLLAPADGATGVPLDARIWIGTELHDLRADPAPRLRERASGNEVSTRPTAISLIGSGLDAVLVLTPESPLAPRTEYELELGAARPPSRFVTGDATLGTRPRTPVVTGVTHESDPFVLPGNSCGSWFRDAFDVDFEGLLLLASTPGAPFDTGRIDGAVLKLTDMRRTGTDLSLGEGACNSGWPGDEAASKGIVFGSFDLAGHFSGWSTPEAAGGCGCAQGPDAAAVALLALSLLKRRRART